MEAPHKRPHPEKQPKQKSKCMGNTYSFENGFIWIVLAPTNGFSQALFLKLPLNKLG